MQWLHPSCLLWRFVFKDTMWTLDIHTHCDMDIYFCCFRGLNLLPPVLLLLILLLLPVSSFPLRASITLEYFVVSAALGGGHRCPTPPSKKQKKKTVLRQLLQQKVFSKCWVCTLGRVCVRECVGYRRAGCAHFCSLGASVTAPVLVLLFHHRLPSPTPEVKVLQTHTSLLLIVSRSCSIISFCSLPYSLLTK